MDMVLEDIVHISAVQLLSDVTKLMQEQFGTERNVKLEMLAYYLSNTINLLECNNEEV